jgi:hypothetical protein
MSRLAVRVLVLLLVAAAPALAAKSQKGDLFKIAPDFASYHVKSIAMLPIATYDRNLEAQRLVAALWGQDLRDTGYRWVSAATSFDLLGGQKSDSLPKVVREDILQDVRVDSLSAPALCVKLHTDAVLAVRVDQWEQQSLLWSQQGRPSTTVQLKAALVDSSGALLWYASGAETAEGPYHDPSTNPLSVSSSGLDQQPIKGDGGPPAYEEVLNRLLLRWAGQFPRPAAAPAPATP